MNDKVSFCETLVFCFVDFPKISVILLNDIEAKKNVDHAYYGYIRNVFDAITAVKALFDHSRQGFLYFD